MLTKQLLLQHHSTTLRVVQSRMNRFLWIHSAAKRWLFNVFDIKNIPVHTCIYNCTVWKVTNRKQKMAACMHSMTCLHAFWRFFACILLLFGLQKTHQHHKFCVSGARRYPEGSADYSDTPILLRSSRSPWVSLLRKKDVVDNPSARHPVEWLQVDDPRLLHLPRLKQEKIVRKKEELARLLEEAAARERMLNEEAKQLNGNILAVQQQCLNLASTTEACMFEAFEDIRQREYLRGFQGWRTSEPWAIGEGRCHCAGKSKHISEDHAPKQYREDARKKKIATIKVFHGTAQLIEYLNDRSFLPL